MSNKSKYLVSKERWKEIMSDWNTNFPLLKPYGSTTLLYRTEIMAIGLYFLKENDDYNPVFSAFPFWRGKSIKHANSIYYPLREVTNHFFHQKIDYIYVKYENDLETYNYLVNKTICQFGDPLNGLISTNSLIKLEREGTGIIRRWWQFHPARSFEEMEMKFAFAYLFNDAKQVKRIRKQITRSHNMFYKYNWGGVEIYTPDWIDAWKDEVFEIFSSREHFLSICEETLKNRQISSLNFVSLKDRKSKKI